eukprot:TRINITY_DN55123_c0_g1_i1.p1 TRINITY_DN55123_c0_g1~~TRINITY_DN55123_c0_g1_i1.p1  ORF type:complete len:137 (-),score=29.35 TRINITY_DN55123_c0_g1_i1:307-717(-)
MACGNAMRAIRALRVHSQNDLDDDYNDATQEDSNVGISQDGLGVPSEDTSESQNQAGEKQVAERERLPLTTTMTTSSTMPLMTPEDQELLLAFPWLGDESSSEEDPNDEGAADDDDDDDFFTPAHRCRCEDLTKIL